MVFKSDFMIKDLYFYNSNFYFVIDSVTEHFRQFIQQILNLSSGKEGE